MDDLTLFDYIILITLGLGLIIGFARGFSTMVLGLLAWVAAFFITIYAFEPTAMMIRRLIDQREAADILSFIGVFVVSLIIFRLLGNAVGAGIRSSAIGFLDRSAGALAGFLMGALTLSIAYLLLGVAISRSSQPDWIRDATLQPLVAYGADIVAVLGPELLERARAQEGSKAALEKARESLPQIREDLENLVDQGQTEVQRQALRRLIEDRLNRCDPDTDENCPEEDRNEQNQ